MVIKIDDNSGFCFGVVYAIDKAEKMLAENNELFCLGQIVHNDLEVERLEKKGLKTIEVDDFKNLNGQKVLLRAHGEPPETYKTAKENNLQIIDASCPIVLRLQLSIKKKYDEIKPQQGQIVIYGQKNHPEIIGLNGQTNNNAIIIGNEQDIENIDFQKPVALFSQTTKNNAEYKKIAELIKGRMKNDNFYFLDSVCKQVANRDKDLKTFCCQFELILFVSGKNSSNGKMLYTYCNAVNPNTKFINHLSDIKKEWFVNIKSVGITGATSTPKWLMEKVKETVENFNI